MSEDDRFQVPQAQGEPSCDIHRPSAQAIGSALAYQSPMSAPISKLLESSVFWRLGEEAVADANSGSESDCDDRKQSVCAQQVQTESQNQAQTHQATAAARKGTTQQHSVETISTKPPAETNPDPLT
eukprot:6189319-Pleurochrysis_carterae.AAC.3